jgi:hypothetical protein
MLKAQLQHHLQKPTLLSGRSLACGPNHHPNSAYSDGLILCVLHNVLQRQHQIKNDIKSFDWGEYEGKPELEL